MTYLAFFADLADGTTLEFKPRSEPTYVDRSGCQRYRTVEARVAYRTEGGKEVLYGYGNDHAPVRITRKVNMKSNPIKHECDARCMNATGRVMNCECSCGGKNHGKGRVMFACEAA